jgi:hypothetical protein
LARAVNASLAGIQIRRNIANLFRRLCFSETIIKYIKKILKIFSSIITKKKMEDACNYDLKSTAYNTGSTFINDQVHDEILPCVKVSYTSKPANHEDSMLEVHEVLLKKKLKDFGDSGPRKDFHYLFQDSKTIFQMDAFTSDSGHTTCIMGFSQKFDQATASSLEWCKKYGPNFGIPANLKKIAHKGGFCMYNAVLDTGNLQVIDYTCFIACDLLLYWYFNRLAAADAADAAGAADAARAVAASAAVDSTYTELVVIAQRIRIARPHQVAEPTETNISYREFLEAYKASTKVVIEGVAREGKIILIDLYVFNKLWKKINDYCFLLVTHDKALTEEEGDFLKAAAQVATAKLNTITFTHMEFTQGEPILYFTIGDGVEVHIYSNSQATLAEQAIIRNNEYSKATTGDGPYGFIIPRSDKKTGISGALSTVASVFGLVNQPMATSRKCVKVIDNMIDKSLVLDPPAHPALAADPQTPARFKAAILAFASSLPKLGGDSAHYVVGQLIQDALVMGPFTNTIVHCVQERPFFTRLMLCNVNILMNAKKSLKLSKEFTTTTAEPRKDIGKNDFVYKKIENITSELTSLETELEELNKSNKSRTNPAQKIVDITTYYNYNVYDTILFREVAGDAMEAEAPEVGAAAVAAGDQMEAVAGDGGPAVAAGAVGPAAEEPAAGVAGAAAEPAAAAAAPAPAPAADPAAVAAEVEKKRKYITGIKASKVYKALVLLGKLRAAKLETYKHKFPFMDLIRIGRGGGLADKAVNVSHIRSFSDLTKYFGGINEVLFNTLPYFAELKEVINAVAVDVDGAEGIKHQLTHEFEVEYSKLERTGKLSTLLTLVQKEADRVKVDFDLAATQIANEHLRAKASEYMTKYMIILRGYRALNMSGGSWFKRRKGEGGVPVPIPSDNKILQYIHKEYHDKAIAALSRDRSPSPARSLSLSRAFPTVVDFDSFFEFELSPEPPSPPPSSRKWLRREQTRSPSPPPRRRWSQKRYSNALSEDAFNEELFNEISRMDPKLKYALDVESYSELLAILTLVVGKGRLEYIEMFKLYPPQYRINSMKFSERIIESHHPPPPSYGDTLTFTEDNEYTYTSGQDVISLTFSEGNVYTYTSGQGVIRIEIDIEKLVKSNDLLFLLDHRHIITTYIEKSVDINNFFSRYINYVLLNTSDELLNTSDELLNTSDEFRVFFNTPRMFPQLFKLAHSRSFYYEAVIRSNPSLSNLYAIYKERRIDIFDDTYIMYSSKDMEDNESELTIMQEYASTVDEADILGFIVKDLTYDNFFNKFLNKIVFLEFIGIETFFLHECLFKNLTELYIQFLLRILTDPPPPLELELDISIYIGYLIELVETNCDGDGDGDGDGASAASGATGDAAAHSLCTPEVTNLIEQYNKKQGGGGGYLRKSKKRKRYKTTRKQKSKSNYILRKKSKQKYKRKQVSKKRKRKYIKTI